MVPLGKIFSKAWTYSLDWKRIAPFFILLVPYLILFAAFADSALGFFAQYGMLSATKTLPLNFTFTLASFFLLLIAVSILVFFVDLYARGVIIENSRTFYAGKKVSLHRSMAGMKGRFFSLVGAVLVITLIAGGLGSIPFVGWIFGIVLSWVFLVVLQSVVVSKKGVIDSIKDSYGVFMMRKWDVFVFWLLLGLITVVMMVVAVIPLLIAAWPVIAALLSYMALGGSGPSVLGAIKENLAQIFVGGLVSAFLLGFMEVFKTSATTFFYTEVKKKKR